MTKVVYDGGLKDRINVSRSGCTNMTMQSGRLRKLVIHVRYSSQLCLDLILQQAEMMVLLQVWVAGCCLCCGRRYWWRGGIAGPSLGNSRDRKNIITSTHSHTHTLLLLFIPAYEIIPFYQYCSQEKSLHNDFWGLPKQPNFTLQ